MRKAKSTPKKKAPAKTRTAKTIVQPDAIGINVDSLAQVAESLAKTSQLLATISTEQSSLSQQFAALVAQNRAAKKG